MSAKTVNLVSVGRVTSIFGIKGWLKVRSDTELEENIFSYSPWWLKTRHGLKPAEVDEYGRHNRGLVVHFKGIDDRDTAARYAPCDIAVEREQMPDLEHGDFYWHQLTGLRVIGSSAGSNCDLGVVARILETGANDVLVVRADHGSIDDKERLVPYIPGRHVKSVNLDNGEIHVDWDPEF